MNSIPKINLLPWRELYRIRKNEQLRHAFITVILLSLMAIGGMYVYQKRQMNYQQAINNDIKNRLGLLDADIERINNLDKQQKALFKKAGIITDLHKNRSAFVRLFEYLAHTSKGLVYFECVSLSADMLTLEGVSKSSVNISQFSQTISMDEQSMMDDVMVIRLQDMSNGTVSFVISAKLVLDAVNSSKNYQGELPDVQTKEMP